MEIFVLRDWNNHNEVSAVLVSHGTTKKELKEIIAMVKQIDGYNYIDLEKALPKDCDIWWVNYDDELFW